MEELERVYVVPLSEAYEKPRFKRARVAVKILRSFVSRHMKVGEESVSLSGQVNDAIWASGIKKPPRRIKIVANRNKDGIVSIKLVGEKEAQEKAAERAKEKEEKRKKATAEKKASEKPGNKAEKTEEDKKESKKNSGPNRSKEG